MNSKPVQKIKQGPISAVIWRNVDKEGKPYPTVSLERIYKDTEGNWKNCHSLRQTDLANASFVLHEALRFIVEQTQKTTGMTGRTNVTETTGLY